MVCSLLQMSATHLIKHTPASAASTATDQNAQITFPIGPLGKESIRVLGGQTNHCMAHTKQSGAWEGGSGTAGGLNPRPPASPGNSEEDDGGGGGGARVKKKRKKKDKKDSGAAAWQKAERESESKPKKRKELKEILPRKSKAPKEVKEAKEVKESKKFKELKSPKEPKKGRKGREAKPKPVAADCKATSSPPRQRGRKPK